MCMHVFAFGPAGETEGAADRATSGRQDSVLAACFGSSRLRLSFGAPCNSSTNHGRRVIVASPILSRSLCYVGPRRDLLTRRGALGQLPLDLPSPMLAHSPDNASSHPSSPESVVDVPGTPSSQAQLFPSLSVSYKAQHFTFDNFSEERVRPAAQPHCWTAVRLSISRWQLRPKGVQD